MEHELRTPPKESRVDFTSAAKRLQALLDRDERFCQNGQILHGAVNMAAHQNDPELLSLLISDPYFGKRFFTRVGDVAIFDKAGFLRTLEQYSRNPDGYTDFKNKIGLSTDGKTLKNQNNIVLVWPYKDAVLEGGQSKEDRSRKEYFLHTEIAAEEIDRLLAPKAFANWEHWDATGKRPAETVSDTDNFIIRGNNLIALHSLAEKYRNAVKLIYIDPPYNTGSDAFLYNDRFGHSTWLTFMKNRLEIAKELLQNDGAIFIQVDDSEFAYLKVLCDEIFGRENFRETIVLKSGTESGVNAINVKRGERLFKVKEYILFYSKTPAFRFRPFYTRAKYNFNYKYKLEKTENGHRLTDLLKVFKEKYSSASAGEKKQKAEEALEKYALNHPEEIFSLEKNIKKAGAKFKEFARKNKKKGIVETYRNAMGSTTLLYDGGTLVPLSERVVEDEKGLSFGVLASDLWVDIGTTPSGEGGVKFANGKKPEKLLHRIIGMATAPGDLVLDYHLGSGTTAAVAHKMGRRYIGIEQMDYGENDATQRLLGVIRGDKTGVSAKVGWRGGGSFIACELAKQNLHYLEAAAEAESADELAEIYTAIAERGDHWYQIEGMQLILFQKEFLKLPLEEMRRVLMELIDANDFYVSSAQMGDPTLGLDERDRKLTEAFYS